MELGLDCYDDLTLVLQAKDKTIALIHLVVFGFLAMRPSAAYHKVYPISDLTSILGSSFDPSSNSSKTLRSPNQLVPKNKQQTPYQVSSPSELSRLT